MTHRIRLERTFPARIDRVFRALVDPVELVRWWGPPEVETSAVAIDLRVGGACRWVLHPNGQRSVLHGRILELDPPRLLVMTHRWEGENIETHITITLEPVPDGTRMTLVHDRLPDSISPDEFARWWSASLESCTTHLGKDCPMPTADTARVCRDYFEAWTSRRGPDALRPLLAERFVFQAGPMRIEGRDQFLASAAWPDGAHAQMIIDAYDGQHGLQLYTATNGSVTVKIVEHLTVADGCIETSETITDSTAFAAFMSGAS